MRRQRVDDAAVFAPQLLAVGGAAECAAGALRAVRTCHRSLARRRHAASRSTRNRRRRDASASRRRYEACAGQPFNALPTARTRSSTVISPSPSASPAGHAEIGAAQRNGDQARELGDGDHAVAVAIARQSLGVAVAVTVGVGPVGVAVGVPGVGVIVRVRVGVRVRVSVRRLRRERRRVGAARCRGVAARRRAGRRNGVGVAVGVRVGPSPMRMMISGSSRRCRAVNLDAGIDRRVALLERPRQGDRRTELDARPAVNEVEVVLRVGRARLAGRGAAERHALSIDEAAPHIVHVIARRLRVVECKRNRRRHAAEGSGDIADARIAVAEVAREDHLQIGVFVPVRHGGIARTALLSPARASITSEPPEPNGWL